MNNEKQQADSEIHENQLLNFLVNALNGSFGVSFGENADFEPEDIHEVLVDTTADGTSISTLCDRSNDSLSGTNIQKQTTLGSRLRDDAKTGLTVEWIQRSSEDLSCQ